MNVLRAIGVGLAGLALVGCTKKDEATVDANVTAAPPPTAASTSTEAGTGAGTGTKTFGGKYSVAAGTMYVPSSKDWSSVKFKSDDGKLLGDGTMTLAIDGSGRVSGITEGGPLGDAVIEGSSDGQALAANVRRKDVADDGLTGTLVATVTGDKVEGTMRLAEFNAAVVRTATFTAAKK